MAKVGRKRPRSMILADRAEIAEMYVRRISIKEMTERLNQNREERYHLSPKMVEYEITVLRREWKERRSDAVDEALEEQLRVLDHVEREAWLQWEKSKQAWIRRSGKQVREDGGGTSMTDVAMQTGSQTGDPRYLQVIVECQRRRAELLGLDARHRETTEVAGVGTFGMFTVRMVVSDERNAIPQGREVVEERGQLPPAQQTV